MPPSNPFLVGQLVTDPAMFFGRQVEMAYLQDASRKSSSVAVVGLRRIGKSSLLYQLAHHTDLAADILITYINLHHPQTRSVAGLLTAVLHGLDKDLHRYQFAPVTNMVEFAEAAEQVRHDGYRPIICLDEVEKLMEQPCFDRDFFEAWRSLGQLGTVAFVTASHARLADVIQPGGKTSPFFNIFTQLDLAGLTDDAARALLTGPFRQAGRPVPAPAYIDQALLLAGRLPLFLQLAGDLLWRHGGTHRLQFREAFEQAAREPMRQLWSNLSADEQAAVTRIVTGQGSVPQWQAAQREALHAGLVDQDGRGSYHPFSPVFGEWIANGTLTRLPAPRPGTHTNYHARPTTPPEPKPTAPAYAYTLIALVSAIIAVGITLLLEGGLLHFFIIFTISLTFILVGDDKLNGGQFLDWLSRLLSRLP